MEEESIEIKFSGDIENLDISIICEDRVFSEKFYFNFSEERLNHIFDAMTKADSGFKKSFQSRKFFSWKFQIINETIKINRFPNLLPFLIKSKFLETQAKPYQKEGIKFLLSKDKGVLADDMGLGKTFQAIASVESLLFSEINIKVVVLCPNPLVEVWLTEFKKWAPIIKVSKLSINNSSDRNELLKIWLKNNVIIIPYSMAKKFSNFQVSEKLDIHLVIADEAHKIRNKSTDIHNALISIKSLRRWFLTGTPLERDHDDLRNLLTALDPSLMGVAADASLEMLYQRYSKLTLRRTKEQVLSDLPNVKKHIYKLALTNEDKEEYKILITKMNNAKMEDRIGFITHLVIAAIGSSHGAKFKKCIEIIKTAQINDQKIIVFCNFNEVLSNFNSVLNNLGVNNLLFNGELNSFQREKTLRDFKSYDGSCVLLANPSIAKEGLTITEANCVIFLNEWWNPSTNRQAEDRVNRIGQQNEVDIHILRSINTIDESLEEILDLKTDKEVNFTSKLISKLTADE